MDDSETIVLIGEAAHPQIVSLSSISPLPSPHLVPYQLGTLFGPALALEDAAVFGALFARLRTADQVGPLLYAYQDMRKNRADALAAIEAHNVHSAFSGPSRVTGGLVRFNVLPPDAPDPPPGATPSDGELAEVGEVWGYYAVDAADEWWVEWGMLRERSRN